MQSERPTGHLPDVRRALHADIEACGYFPALVEDAIDLAVAGEQVRHYLVHHEPTFSGDEIHRHLTILVLTPTRLIVGHTDEGHSEPGRPQPEPQAVTSTESVGLNRINTVTVTRVVTRPAAYRPQTPTVPETWLTVGWGVMRRLELEPASCETPDCDADHGFSGSLVADDLIVRISEAADGEQVVAQLVSFGTELQLVAGQAGSRA